jgi:phage I-like protein
VDYDHGDSRGTEAAGWLTELKVEPGYGLAGVAEFTPGGAQMLSTKTYRWPSVEWELDAAGRPCRLLAVALTNRPNLPVQAILNSDSETKTKTPKTKPPMEAILAALGLAADAGEAAALAAIKALQDAADAANAAALETAANAFVAANSALILPAKRDEVKAAYKLCPEAVKNAFAHLAPPPPPRVVNSFAAKTPAQPSGSGVANHREAMAALPPGERKAYYAAHKNEIDRP